MTTSASIRVSGMPAQAMDRETSIYLDLVRFSAAVTVLLAHFSFQRLTGGLAWWFHPFGTEAVAVFFVLSGYVIAYVTDARETTPGAYAVHRLARIYSVALPALIATFLFDRIGRQIDPALYWENWAYDDRLQSLFISAFFVQRFWFLEIDAGSNIPYWSLGFEVPYYLIFGILHFARPPWRVPLAAVALLIVGPRIAALFPVWLLGVACYRLRGRLRLSPAAAAALCIGPMLLWLGYQAIALIHGRIDHSAPPWLGEDAYQYWLTGSLFALHLAAFPFVAPRLAPALRRFEQPIRWCAGRTFSLYLFHMPTMHLLTALLPGSPSYWLSRIVLLAGTVVICLVLAEVTELRRNAWRRFFAGIPRSLSSWA